MSLKLTQIETKYLLLHNRARWQTEFSHIRGIPRLSRDRHSLESDSRGEEDQGNEGYGQSH
ncbi:unnamed protein product [Brassica oleracea]